MAVRDDAPRKYRKIFEDHEDEQLRRLVEQYGCEDWGAIASQMEQRTPRQCRERYKTYLCPDVNTEPWTNADEQLLMEKYHVFGSKWSDFRPFFPNRTVNNIKNHWHTLTRRNRHAMAKSSPPPAPAIPQRREEPTGLAVYNISNLLNHDHRVFC
jgi:hypothetical protein